jgi:beta-lactamase class A
MAFNFKAFFSKKISLLSFLSLLLICSATLSALFYLFLNQRQSSQNIKYHINRAEGYKRISPLLYAEPSVESKCFLPMKKAIHVVIDSLIKTGDLSASSVYIKECQEGQWCSVYPEKTFHPASLMKVLLLLTHLKNAEPTPDYLTRKIKFDLPDTVKINTQYYSTSSSLQRGQSYTMHELLYFMAAESDNYATRILWDLADGGKINQLSETLGFPPLKGKEEDFLLRADTYSKLFKVIYNASYLNPAYSEYAADILSNCTFKGGLSSGFPTSISKWHKYGEWQSQGFEPELHDSGIVNIDGQSFLITIMTRGKKIDKLSACIKRIAQVSYANLISIRT